MKTISLRYASDCKNCGIRLAKGDDAVYMPKTRGAKAFVLCGDCAAPYRERDREARDYEDSIRHIMEDRF